MNSTADLSRRSPQSLAPVSTPFGPARPLSRLIEAVDTWRRRHKSSMQCARLETHVLRDLGISEAQRFIAVNKPFWEK